MKHRHIPRTLVAVLLLAAVAIAAPAWAIIIINNKTGLFGVTGGQTIRVSVLNASDRGSIQPCTKVFDMSGTMLAEVEGMPLRPGEGTFVDFNAADFGLREGQRMQVRVELEAQPPDQAQPPDPLHPPDPGLTRPDDVILTLEVFDTETGKTVFTMPWVQVGFNPQPEPPAAR